MIQPHLPITATLLRLHPNHLSHLRRLAPNGYLTDFRCYKLSWCDGRCVQGRNVFTRLRADPRLLVTPDFMQASCSLIRTETGFKRLALSSPTWLPRCTSHCSTCCSPGHKGHDDLTSSPPFLLFITSLKSAQLNDGN